MKELKDTMRRALLLLTMVTLCSFSALARQISGMVVDENGEPLTGATVQEVPVSKTASIAGCMVDINGHFHLDVANGVKQFKVSFVGYNPQTIDLTSENSYKIQLTPNVAQLDEVVITGYQTISKERATGSFAKVNADDLEATQRVNSVASLLEGHVAGYQDGQLRGVTSMNGVTTPLYVIDGFPVEKTKNDGYGNWVEEVPDINVEDIESITVLKDAAATSIYGARAANGVIVITTKRAAKGQVKVDLSMNLTFQPYRTYTGHLADAATMVDLERAWAAQNPNLQGEGAADYATQLLGDNTYTTPGIQAILKGYAGQLSQGEVDGLLNQYAKGGYQYYKDIDKYGKKNPFYQQYNLRVASSNDRNSFVGSFSYRHNQFADKYNKDQNFGISLQNTTNITDWLTFDVGAFVDYGNGETPNYLLSSPGFTYMPYMSLGTPGSPYINYEADRYSTSQLNTLSTYGLLNLDINPLEEMKWQRAKTNNLSARTYARLNIRFTDYLRLTTQFQYQAARYKTEFLREKESYYVRNMVNQFATPGADGTEFLLPNGNIYQQAYNSQRDYNFRVQLDFNKTFVDKHNVTALAGFELRENVNKFNDYTLYNYDPELLTYTMLDQKALSNAGGVWGWASFTNQNVAFNRELTNRFVSWYANAAYDYDNRYTVTGSIRWDRTNLFGTSSKYQNHPIWSVGAGWLINNEEFMQGIDWVNLLKLRASYGIGGNIAKGAAPYMTFNFGSNNHVNQGDANVATRPNPNLRWEKTTTFDIGVDFALFNNRLTGAIDFYNKKGTDLLANTNGVPVEGYGFTTYSINNGEMTNRGVEISLNGDIIRQGDWNWNAYATFAYNHNKVDAINVEAPVLFLVFDYPTAYPRVGNPYNAIYAYEWAGLDENGKPQVYDAEGNLYSGMEPSNIEDAQYFGSLIPKVSGSFGTSLRWKDLTLSMLFMFETGHKMWNTLKTDMSTFGQAYADYANRWQKPGDEAFTDIPVYTSSESPNYNYYDYSIWAHSSANVVPADNFRMRNLSLSYNLPKAWASKAYMSNVRVMVGAENLFMICRDSRVKYMLGGYDRPNYTFGINIEF